MKKSLVLMAALALIGVNIAASATINIETVTVGDPGNVADTTGFGSVYYIFNIGKYEVTAGQYCAFLNAVAKDDRYDLYNILMDLTLYPQNMGCNIVRTGSPGNYSYSVAPEWANRPVNYVSFYDACRFANWLHNGQPTGDQDETTTERGAYVFYWGNWYMDHGRNIQREEGARWAVTSEDEWYKAAYYKGGGTNAGYWLYPTRSDSVPSNSLENPDSGNNANLFRNVYTLGAPYWRTNVGEFENSASAYGTFDQGGNVWEWTEAIVYEDLDCALRGVRGGAFWYFDQSLQSIWRCCAQPWEEDATIGFRVVQLYVPEISSTIALLGGMTGVIGLSRRKA